MASGVIHVTIRPNPSGTALLTDTDEALLTDTDEALVED